MKLYIGLKKIQHLTTVEFEIDIDGEGLTCITGKNGAGKTTLVKAIRNITNADTFVKTSSDDIFNSESAIEYRYDGRSIVFEYDPALKTLNSKSAIPDSLKAKIDVELPIPHGERFNFFQKISGADADIRRAIALERYGKPTELIDFLHEIYLHAKFDRLVEIKIKKSVYYCSLLASGRYLREDYLSSGEYFLISLYRRIIKGSGLIVVDEIDISLDAAAQVRLVKKLRDFGAKYKVGFLFTTHSLAMMRTLHDKELFYMDRPNDTAIATIDNVSFNYVKSILFGFKGWDKYILTEDDVLKDFIEHVVNAYCGPLFYKYKIIFIGGSSNTTDLMRRNASEQFLSGPENVISVLDGDQKKFRHAKKPKVFCIPFESVEKGLLTECLSGGLADIVDISKILSCDVNKLKNYLLSTAINQKDNSNRKNILFFNVKKVACSRWFFVFCRKIEKIFSGKKSNSACSEKEFNNASKDLFKYLLDNKLISRSEINAFLCGRKEKDVKEFALKINEFLMIEKPIQ